MGYATGKTFLPVQQFTVTIGNGTKLGIWQELNHTLRNRVREKMGRSVQPTALAFAERLVEKLAVGIAPDLACCASGFLASLQAATNTASGDLIPFQVRIASLR